MLLKKANVENDEQKEALGHVKEARERYHASWQDGIVGLGLPVHHSHTRIILYRRQWRQDHQTVVLRSLSLAVGSLACTLEVKSGFQLNKNHLKGSRLIPSDSTDSRRPEPATDRTDRTDGLHRGDQRSAGRGRGLACESEGGELHVQTRRGESGRCECVCHESWKLVSWMTYS